MKNPIDIAKQFEQQWGKPAKRSQILDTDYWPLIIEITAPSAEYVKRNDDALKQDLIAWKNVTVGYVEFHDKHYNSLADKLSVPLTWAFKNHLEWIKAIGTLIPHSHAPKEYRQLEQILQHDSVNTLFYDYIIKNFNTLKSKPEADIINAASIAMQLNKGMAKGKPLRSLKLNDIDTKFYEKNDTLLIRLLEIRFPNENFSDGLAAFLDASHHSSPKVIIKDLDNSITLFKEFHVYPSDLLTVELPAKNIIIIENQNPVHYLPKLENTIAILGAGNNLSWMKAKWLEDKNIAYWGDMDTWGMFILNQARQHQPKLNALMMHKQAFNQYKDEAIKEETITKSTLIYLSPEENEFYLFLAKEDKGRLEQEFLPETFIQHVLSNWHERTFQDLN
ncbi:MAG: hypothetical protein KAG18_03820 [Sinobacterium sp.]|nr:hypothetical protein [Sinobacterium sp.]